MWPPVWRILAAAVTTSALMSAVSAQPIVSPSGEHFAYVVAGSRGSALRVDTPTSGSYGTTMRGRFAGAIKGVRWSADSKRLYFLVDRQGNGRFDLWEAAWPGGTARKRASLVSDFCGVAMDGRISFLRQRADAVDQEVLDAAGRPLERLHHKGLAWVGCAGVEPSVALRADSGGRLRWVVRSKSDWLPMSLAQDQGPDVVRPLHLGAPGEHHFSAPDAEGLAQAWGLATDGSATQVAMPPDFNVSALLVDREGRPLAAKEDRLLPRWHFLDARFAEQVERSRVPDTVLMAAEAVPFSNLALLKFCRDDGPCLFRLLDTSTGNATWPYDESLPERISKVEAHTVIARDGMPLPTYVSLPLGERRARPAVLVIHGGPRSRLHLDQLQSQNRLAAKGYVVLTPHFRGSDGFGAKHLHAGDGQWDGAIIDDLADVLSWAEVQGLLRKGQVVAQGGSFGGYAAKMLAARYPELLSGVIAEFSPNDLSLFLRRVHAYQPATVVGLVQMLGSDNSAALRTKSPISNPIPPLKWMLIDGGRDPFVAPEDVAAFARKVASTGAPFVQIMFEQEGHGLRQQGNWAFYSSLVDRFLESAFNGAPMALRVPTALKNSVRVSSGGGLLK